MMANDKDNNMRLNKVLSAVRAGLRRLGPIAAHCGMATKDVYAALHELRGRGLVNHVIAKGWTYNDN